jgi:hypothetical protein
MRRPRVHWTPLRLRELCCGPLYLTGGHQRDRKWDTVISIGYQWRIGRLMEIGEGPQVGWTQCTPPGFSGGQLGGIQAHCSPPESTEGLWVSSGSRCRSLPIDAVSTAGYITGQNGSRSNQSTFSLRSIDLPAYLLFPKVSGLYRVRDFLYGYRSRS